MSADIKNGKYILDNFFKALKNNNNLDSIIVQKIVDLYGTNKLTDTNLTNELSSLRDAKDNGKD